MAKPHIRLRAEMTSEVASRRRDPFEWSFNGLLRPDDALLLDKGGHDGVRLYRDLLKDGTVYKCFQQRVLALVGRAWTVEADDDSEPQAAFAAEQLTQMLARLRFDRLSRGLLGALLTGYAVTEIVWGVVDGQVCPVRAIARDPRRFVFVQDGDGPPELRMLTRDDMLRGVPVPARKFIVHAVGAEDDDPYGASLGRQLYWPVFFKRHGIASWNKLNDRFGTPTPWGQYPRNASAKEKDTLFAALRAMTGDGVVMTPEGSTIQLLESALSASINSQESLVRYMDEWIAGVLLGQEPRAGGGGALAAASKEREDVRLELTQADSDMLSETLNETLLTWVCEFNGWPGCAVYRVIKSEDNKKAMAETDQIVESMGFTPDLDYIRGRYGDGWQVKSAPALALPAAQFAEPAADAIDVAIAEEMDDWRVLLDPLAAPLEALFARARREGWTAAALLAALPGVLAQMDTAPLTDSLARLNVAARVAGEEGGVL